MKPAPRSSKRTSSLVTLLLGTGVFAVAAGGALVARPDGSLLRLSTEPTPFATHLVPGLLLAVLVGGTQLLAGAAMRRGDRRRLRMAALAGGILAGWMALQAVMLSRVTWLQPVGFMLAFIELMLVAASQPREAPAAKRRFGHAHRRR